MRALSARFYDGRRAAAQPCELHWVDQRLQVRGGIDGPRSYARSEVVWPERTRHGQRQLLLPDGGVVQLPDAQAWDAWAADAGLGLPLAVRWALSWRLVALSFALLLLSLFAAWRWGIPWAARGLANRMPVAWEQDLGRQVMKSIDGGWLEPSQVPEAEREAYAAAVKRMVEAAYPVGARPDYRLHWRRAPEWLGPNAFALPGGDIVVSDAMVEMARLPGGTVNPMLLGVLAHELGHVRERHGLRMVLEAGAVSTLAGWWIGDYSALLAAAPAWLAQSHYSRDHERQADLESLRVMRAAGIDPRCMTQLFERLRMTLKSRDGESRSFGLASHPADSERIRFFEQGATP